MDVTRIPFNTFLGLEKCAAPHEGLLQLRASGSYANHLGSVHASAQFALAEAASGAFLLERFKSIAEKETLIPVVRKAEVKFRAAGHGRLTATAAIDEAAASRIPELIEAKGRAIIPVVVTIKNSDGAVTMTATYEWFVQKVEKSAQPGVPEAAAS